MQRTKLNRHTNPDLYSVNGRQLQESDQFIERKLIIGLITSDEICELCSKQFDPILFRSQTARKLAMVIYDYYNRYQKAPGQDMEALYFEKLKEGEFFDEEAEELEQDILPDLSGEFSEQGIDTKYLIDNVHKYRKERLSELASEAIANGHLERGRKLLDEIEATGEGTITEHSKTIGELMKQKLPKPKLLMRPWLREGETTILYSPPGVGKSLLAILISHLQCCKNYNKRECEIGGWQVKKPVRTYYMDGEMGRHELIKRFRQFKHLGPQIKKAATRVFIRGEYEQETGKPFSLSKRADQQLVLNYLSQNPDIKLVILDSISTLFDLEDENSNSEWNNKINPFLRGLRELGVAHIVQHHAGKNITSGPRGASAMGVMAHNIIRLKNHPNKQPGEAWFEVKFEKQREGGKSFGTFNIRFRSDGQETWFEVTDNERRSARIDGTKLTILRGLDQNLMLKEIAAEAGTSSQNINEHKKTMRKRGLITGQDKITDYGYSFIEVEEG